MTYGSATASSQTGGPPYDDPDGGKSYVLSHPSGTADAWMTAHSIRSVHQALLLVFLLTRLGC